MELDLVCVLGYTGKHSHCLIHHPIEKNIILFPIGSILLLSDLHDPHNQHFLRNGHDENISFLTISKNGQFIATTQIPSSHEKDNFATICVWDYYEKKLLHQFRAHKNVYGLSFSDDNIFLVSIGDKKVYFWNLDENGTCFGGCNINGKGSFIQFLEISKDFNKRRPSYELVYADNKVGKLKWAFEIKKMMSYKLTKEEFKYPGRLAGIKRTYTCLVMDSNNQYCFVGTRLGEIMVFDAKYNSFKTSLLVSSNGIHSLTYDNKSGNLYCGGGDGTIKIVSKGENWRIVKQVQTNGKVTSLSQSYSDNTFVAGVDSGRIIKYDSSSLKMTKVIVESHIDYVTSVAISKNCEYFCTTSKDGRLINWDLSNYSMINVFKSIGYPTCAIYLSSTEILAGYSTGFISLYDTKTNKKKYDIVNAHQGAVTKLAVCTAGKGYIVSGGEDGAVRLFTWGRELVGQFKEHKRSVSGLLIDIKLPHILHSCSLDKSVFSYDLKSNRKVSYHSLAGSSLTCLSQRVDSENELVTGTLNGNILLYDIDYENPVDSFGIGKIKITSVDVSRKTGKYLAIGLDNGELMIYSFSAKKIVMSGNKHCSSVVEIKWSNDEKQLVSVGSDASISIWNFYN